MTGQGVTGQTQPSDFSATFEVWYLEAGKHCSKWYFCRPFYAKRRATFTVNKKS